MSLQLPQPLSSNDTHLDDCCCHCQDYRYILEKDIEATLLPSPWISGTLCFITHGTNVCFRRARVVSDNNNNNNNNNNSDDERVLIRYPKGSTYRVRRTNICPVLEHEKGLVLIYPETPAYRKSCVTHTYQNDRFLEIGCDFGPTIDKVQRGLQQGGIVSMDANQNEKQPIDEEVPPMEKTKVQCLGIDKSQVSIDIAKERYPHCYFTLEDALTVEGTQQLRQLCQDVMLGGYPTIVAIDINGNREISAVMQCINHLMNPINPPDGWVLPRLIIVKSRLLHHAMLAKQEMENSTKS